MKSGDLVTPKTDDVYLFSDYLEKSTDANETFRGTRVDLRKFPYGTMGIVIELNPQNTCRVKVMYDHIFWWTNVSDLDVISK